jgi:predicted O-linked N-acetylglucosamine transferase (SPINDLY family)
VAPLPSSTAGIVTFGSFNKTEKITPATAALWARLLHKITNARLVLKWSSFDVMEEQDRHAAMFEAHGIARHRLEFRGASSYPDTLAQYADIDIALDPFPYSGGATSCDALYMGVPVVTMPGERFISRQTSGYLSLVGLKSLIASDEQDYIAIAAGLARDPARLETIRASLRDAMLRSPLCDGPSFARSVESAYIAMWHRWCANSLDSSGLPQRDGE